MVKTYVIDTNVLIQAPYAMQCFEENQVVLPLVVLEELDGLKKADGERGANARRAIRFLEKLRGRGDLLQGVPLDNGGFLRVEANCVDVELPESLPEDPAGESAAGASGLTGTALNLLFFIEMGGSGEEGYFAEVPEGETLTRREQTLSLFNEQPLGVKNYFAEISGSAFTLHTVEVPGVYVDGHTQAYYLP